MAELGGTFRFANTEIDEHLHIIISDPALNPDKIVTANFTSWRGDKDQSCVVEVGEHPQITKRSCIDYRRDICITLAQYEATVASGHIVPQQPVDRPFLERILEGAAVSPHIPLGNQQTLIDQGLIDGD